MEADKRDENQSHDGPPSGNILVNNRIIEIKSPLSFYSEFVEYGVVDIEFMSEYEVILYHNICESLDAAVLPRNRKEEKWHKVERITLFDSPKGLRRAHSLGRHSPQLANLSAEIRFLVRFVGQSLGKVPEAESAHLLAAGVLSRYSPTRVVINVMDGTPDEPAIIRPHTDPVEESGVVAVVTLDEAPEVPAGTLRLYACHDLATVIGIQQLEHSVVSASKRYSLAFTNWPTDKVSGV